jgi:hypothetical protein
MKNMKRLISIIAVIAMMLSMATVAFATAIDTSTESLSIVVNSQEILEGSTDTFYVTVTCSVESTTSAANGFSNIDLSVNFDEDVISVPDSTAWTLTGYTEEGTMLYGTAASNNGSQGVLRIGYKGATLAKALASGAVFSIPFELADGAVAGDSTDITITGRAAVSTYNAAGKANLNWVTTANVTNYATAGAVTVISDTPAPQDPVVTPASGEAGEAGTTVVWGTAANVTPVANGKDGEGNDIYTYTSEAGAPVEFGVQITDGEFAGFYPALGLKEGKFAIKFIGDAASNLLTQIYLKVDGVLQD